MEKTIWLNFRFCWMYHGWPWWLNKFWNQEGRDKKGARKYWAQKIGVGLKLPSGIHFLSFFNNWSLLRSMDNRDLESSISALLITFPQCRLNFLWNFLFYIIRSLELRVEMCLDFFPGLSKPFLKIFWRNSSSCILPQIIAWLFASCKCFLWIWNHKRPELVCITTVSIQRIYTHLGLKSLFFSLLTIWVKIMSWVTFSCMSYV